jgi:hypothetical protein
VVSADTGAGTGIGDLAPGADGVTEAGSAAAWVFAAPGGAEGNAAGGSATVRDDDAGSDVNSTWGGANDGASSDAVPDRWGPFCTME